MNRVIFSLITVIILLQSCTKDAKYASLEKPKIVIGIVVDQMRYDYLTKYRERFSEGGFMRLLNEGFSLSNAHFNHVPTYTAVGHTSIYTGTTPDHHGIIGNGWYDKYAKNDIYCVSDTAFASVGIEGNQGRRSPFRMITTTVTDQLHLGQNMRGKTIGIAIKDRSAILPAGHTANGAYWYVGKEENKWITSSYYMHHLPKWVQDFNMNNKADEYLSKPWTPLYDIATYTQSIADHNPYEGKFKGEEAPVFPHDLPALREKNKNYDLIKGTPFGNSLTFDFAKAAILGEQLGKTASTDFLAISFSSTDYVGHQFGPDAVEVEDMYLRFDLEMANFLHFLDLEIGKGNYTIFLTADHGVVQIPAYLKSVKIPAQYFDSRKFDAFLKNITAKKFGSKDIIEHSSNYQIFLNKEEIQRRRLDEDEVTAYLVQQCISFDGIYKAVSSRTLQTTNFTEGVLAKLQNGYNQKYSGDVLLIPTPGSISMRGTGTTHGSGYSYDTHVPVIFYGKGIKKGTSSALYGIRDIAPTIAKLLQIEFPDGTTGEIINEVLE